MKTDLSIRPISIRSLSFRKMSSETVIVQAICDSARCFSCGGLVYAVEKQRTTKHVRCHCSSLLVIDGRFRSITIDVFGVEFANEISMDRRWTRKATIFIVNVSLITSISQTDSLVQSVTERNSAANVTVLNFNVRRSKKRNTSTTNIIRMFRNWKLPSDRNWLNNLRYS